MPNRIYITGGWGYGNLGDDAILKVTLEQIKASFPKAEQVVTSYTPERLRKYYGIPAFASLHRLLGLRTFSRWEFNFPSLYNKLIRAIWESTGVLLPSPLKAHVELMAGCDLVVMAGGGYFNDPWSGMRNAQYFIVDLATKLGKTIVFEGQTLGPFYSPATDPKLAKALSRIELIGCRDAGSVGVATAALGARADKCVRTADVVNLLPEPADPPEADGSVRVGVMIQNFRRHHGVSGDSPAGALSTEEAYIQAVVEALAGLSAQRTVKYVFIPSTWSDIDICGKIHDAVLQKGVAVAEPPGRLLVDEFIRRCKSVDVMLSTNMHPVIVAASSNKPSIALSYSFKLNDYMKDIGLDSMILSIDDFDSAGLLQRLLEMVDRRAEFGAVVAARMPGLRELAMKNFELVERVAALVDQASGAGPAPGGGASPALARQDAI